MLNKHFILHNSKKYKIDFEKSKFKRILNKIHSLILRMVIPYWNNRISADHAFHRFKYLKKQYLELLNSEKKQGGEQGGEQGP